jgi:hypothetical protein
MLPPNSAVEAYLLAQGGFPALTLPGGVRLEKPSREWLLHQLRWKWLLDSYEGGEAYRTAVYGTDLKGMPVRNLIRHKREYPLPPEDGVYSPYVGRPAGTDQAAQATDDDYELRRARTPVPMFVSQVVGEHTSKIYNNEIKRDGPPKIVAWWNDVDGCGASMDQFMADTAAPLLLLFGQLDFLIENAPKPEGEEVVTRADEIRLGLDKCEVSYILPVNLPWWKVDRKGRYVECLVREVGGDGDSFQFRYWTAQSWILFDSGGEIVDQDDHNYGRVPIVRCFDQRRASCRFIGKPRYEEIAEIQREYYNRDSELILSDTLQAHPVLQMPSDLLRPDASISIGPGYVLPMAKLIDGGFQGSEYVEAPKGGADSLRTNKSDLRDAADRAACLTKPAGAAGTTGQTVGQSGVSKRLDQNTGNELLGKIAKTLQRAEETISEYAAAVLGVPIDPQNNSISISYPGQFDLYDADELLMMAQGYVLFMSQAGAAPAFDLEVLNKLAQLMLPGQDDDQYAEYDDEFKAALQQRALENKARRESLPSDPNADPDASSEPPGSNGNGPDQEDAADAKAEAA